MTGGGNTTTYRSVDISAYQNFRYDPAVSNSSEYPHREQAYGYGAPSRYPLYLVRNNRCCSGLTIRNALTRRAFEGTGIAK